MQSGVPNYLPDDYAKMDKAIAAAPGKHWTAEEVLSYDTAEPTQADSRTATAIPAMCCSGC